MRIPLLLVLVAIPLTAACRTTRTGSPPAGNSAGDSAEVAYVELRAALLDLSERDQAARNALVATMADVTPGPDGSITLDEEQARLMKGVQAIDAESTRFLRTTIDEFGWPTYDMVGKEAAHAAWLLAQHADADPELQSEVLRLMEPLVAAGQAGASDFAYLTDRVRVARGDKQLYGTQFSDDGSGVARPVAIEDAANVDARRAEVGLEPLAEYAATLAEAYGTETSAEPADG